VIFAQQNFVARFLVSLICETRICEVVLVCKSELADRKQKWLPRFAIHEMSCWMK